MEKALEMGKTSATGSFQLFIGIATSTLILAVGTIILARLMTPEEYGLYSVALIPSYMIALFREWGVDSAIVRYSATFRAQNRQEHAKKVITAGLLFEVSTGIMLMALSVALSNFIATTVFHRPESAQLIAIVSITIFSGALLTAFQASFKGFERMELYSLTAISQSIVKTTLSPLLVFMGYSALGAVLGYTISFLAASIIGLTVLYLAIFKNLKKEENPKTSLSKTLKNMLHYGFPLSISSILTGFLAQFYSFLMAIYCADAIIGNFQVATQFATLLTFFTFPISTVLFPTFSKINPQEEKKLLQTVFASSVKYAAMLLVPATTATMVLSKPLIATLFGEKWTFAPLFLALYVINNLYVVFGNLSIGSLLAGVGETKTLMKLSLITTTLGIPMALALIPTMGIMGLIIVHVLAGVPSMFIGLYLVWKNYSAKADFKTSAKVFFSSALAVSVTFLILNFANFPDWVELVLGGATFLLTYLISAPLTGAINSSDARNLKIMFSNLGVVSKLLNIPLTMMEKIINNRMPLKPR